MWDSLGLHLETYLKKASETEFIDIKTPNLCYKVKTHPDYFRARDWYLHPDDQRILDFNNKLNELIDN